jgi:hypothetical protein
LNGKQRIHATEEQVNMLELTGLPVCNPVKFIIKYVSSAAFIIGNGMHTITLLLY